MNEPVSILDAEHYQGGEVCDGWHLLQQDVIFLVISAPPSHGDRVE